MGVGCLRQSQTPAASKGASQKDGNRKGNLREGRVGAKADQQGAFQWLERNDTPSLAKAAKGPVQQGSISVG